jgi:hypothetical protein
MKQSSIRFFHNLFIKKRYIILGREKMLRAEGRRASFKAYGYFVVSIMHFWDIPTCLSRKLGSKIGQTFGH